MQKFPKEINRIMRLYRNVCFCEDCFLFVTNPASCIFRPEDNTSFFSLLPTTKYNRDVVETDDYQSYFFGCPVFSRSEFTSFLSSIIRCSLYINTFIEPFHLTHFLSYFLLCLLALSDVRQNNQESLFFFIGDDSSVHKEVFYIF